MLQTRYSGSPFEDPCSNGFLIQENNSSFESIDFMLPVLVEYKNYNCQNDFFLISPRESLYVYALALLYKFLTVEEYNLPFENSRKFTSAHFKISHMKEKPWFPSREEKLAMTNQELFFEKFFDTVVEEIESIYIPSAFEIKNKTLNELMKLKPYIKGEIK